MHLVSVRRQRVRVPAAGLELTFEADEPIWTESSYKYTPGQLHDMLARAGFDVAAQWIDRKTLPARDRMIVMPAAR